MCIRDSRRSRSWDLLSLWTAELMLLKLLLKLLASKAVKYSSQTLVLKRTKTLSRSQDSKMCIRDSHAPAYKSQQPLFPMKIHTKDHRRQIQKHTARYEIFHKKNISIYDQPCAPPPSFQHMIPGIIHLPARTICRIPHPSLS